MAGPQKTRRVKLDLATLGAIPAAIWTLGFVSLLISVPENNFAIEAVASAIPSMMPTSSIDAPSTVTR
jgi:hypothetical protein